MGRERERKQREGRERQRDRHERERERMEEYLQERIHGIWGLTERATHLSPT